MGFGYLGALAPSGIPVASGIPIWYLRSFHIHQRALQSKTVSSVPYLRDRRACPQGRGLRPEVLCWGKNSLTINPPSRAPPRPATNPNKECVENIQIAKSTIPKSAIESSSRGDAPRTFSMVQTSFRPRFYIYDGVSLGWSPYVKTGPRWRLERSKRHRGIAVSAWIDRTLQDRGSVTLRLLLGENRGDPILHPRTQILFSWCGLGDFWCCERYRIAVLLDISPNTALNRDSSPDSREITFPPGYRLHCSIVVVPLKYLRRYIFSYHPNPNYEPLWTMMTKSTEL